MCMQNLRKLADDRLLAEWKAFDVNYPNWLEHILDDDLLYVITLIVVSANSFCIGLVVGWICTL